MVRLTLQGQNAIAEIDKSTAYRICTTEHAELNTKNYTAPINHKTEVMVI